PGNRLPRIRAAHRDRAHQARLHVPRRHRLRDRAGAGSARPVRRGGGARRGPRRVRSGVVRCGAVRGCGVRRAGGLLGAVVATTIAFAACGENVPSVAPTATPSPEPTATTTVYQLGTEVWYEGLTVEIVSVTAT